MKYFELLNFGKARLEKAGIETAEYDARELLSFASEKSLELLLVMYRDMVPNETESLYRLYIDLRSRRYPLQYIMGYAYFFGYKFSVDERVLIPRPETEEVVLAALKMVENESFVRALDLCTGSGCMGISFYLERKKDGLKTELGMADISEEALEVAGENAVSLICGQHTDFEAKSKSVAGDISEMLREQNVSIINSDIFSNIHERYDIIISNPPYIKSGDIPGLMPEVKVYEPRLALDGVSENTDGLTFYEKIIKDASKVLNKNGKICFEIGSDEGEAVRRLLVDNSFDDINVMKDINGRDRIVTAIVQ